MGRRRRTPAPFSLTQPETKPQASALAWKGPARAPAALVVETHEHALEDERGSAPHHVCLHDHLLRLGPAVVRGEVEAVQH